MKKLDLEKNKSNKGFYEALSPESMKKIAMSGGLDSCEDLKLLNSVLDKSKSILEVGAGYGRVIEYLLENNPTIEITALERSPGLFDYLKKKYFNKVDLLNNDIYTSDIGFNKYDLILYLWSGIQDFSELEQKILFKKLSMALNCGGILVIDTIPPDVQPIGAERLKGQNAYFFKTNGNTAYVHDSSHSQLVLRAEGVKLKVIKQIFYMTSANRKRELHLFQK